MLYRRDSDNLLKPDLISSFVQLQRYGSMRHQPINIPTAGAQAFPMDGIGRLVHDPTRGPSADWRVLTTADAAVILGWRKTRFSEKSWSNKINSCGTK
ncbi:hypothetical protein evm_014989 [Chilo suppressalis]|nr:hypothetical protein evm_014989 [Chilo suppressalis]